MTITAHAFTNMYVVFVTLCQLEEQLSHLQREKNDLQTRMEEDQEDLNELMKKHKAAVAQVCLSPCLPCRCHVFSTSTVNKYGVLTVQLYSFCLQLY